MFKTFNFIRLKHPFSSFQLRQALAATLLGSFFALSFYGGQRPGPAGTLGLFAPGRAAELVEEEDGDGPRPDRPDLALAQDVAATRDPATGTVPRERLLAAARFNETKLKNQVQQRTTASVLAAAPWVERGPSNVAGRIISVALDPTDATGNTLWAGAAGGGLWKATNATTTSVQWQNVNSYFSNLAITAIAVVPGTIPVVIYCGTGEGFFNGDAIRGAGIWKSSDGGASWAQLPVTASNSDFWRIQKIVVHPVTKDVYAATRQGGLYRSQDGGTTWARVLNTTTSPGSATTRVADIEIAADNTLFVSFGIFYVDGIYRSATGNVGSWTNLNTLAGSGLPSTGYNRIELACAPSDANRVYALLQSSAADTPILNVYRSMDGGTTWTAMPKPGGSTFDFTRNQAWYDLTAGVSPTDANVLYVGGIDVWLTTNGGAATPTWSKRSDWTASETATNYIHADQHDILFVPSASAPSNQAYFASDGGIAYSANASSTTSTFSGRNNGLNVTQYYGLAMHPTNNNYFLAGAQDNGTQRYSAAGMNATVEVSGGDGGLCAIDQYNPNLQISSYVYNQYFRSTNGSTFSGLINISSTAGQFINPLDYDSRSNVLYAGHNADLYLAWTNVSTATGPTATITPSLGTGAGKVTHVTASPLTLNRAYFGTAAGKLLRVDNANTTTPTVKTLYTGGATTSVSCVAVDPANEQHLLVTYSNYGIVSVLETTNADAATPTWTSVEGDLPDMPVRWALFDPRNTARAILATEMGVYATDLLAGATTTWSPMANLANTRIDMVRYRSGDKLVAAATHGRGLFTSTIFNTAAPLPVTLAKFSGTRTAQGALLSWQTATELNSQRFDVQRSGNAVDFSTVGTVAAAGTAVSPRSYAYTDASAREGLYYYRLRQVDVDGTSTYSPVVAVQGAAVKALLSSAYPNPFASTLTLALAQEPTSAVVVTLTDAQGRRAYAATERTSARQLKLAMPASLAPGTYVLTVQYNGQVSRSRVAKR